MKKKKIKRICKNCKFFKKCPAEGDKAHCCTKLVDLWLSEKPMFRAIGEDSDGMEIDPEVILVNENFGCVLFKPKTNKDIEKDKEDEAYDPGGISFPEGVS